MAEDDARGGPPPPRANPELVGHAEAEAALLAGYRSGRLAHAWLLAGPPGIGKATLAYRFARFVLAGGGGGLFADAAPTLALDAGDPVFRRVAAGSHADLLTVARSYDERRKRLRDEIVVDDARAVGPFLRLTAAEGGWRVVVVDCADELNIAAANTLLKVIEEPPEKALVLLVSHTPGRLLATIRSRCRRLVMRPLDEGCVSGFLARYRPGIHGDEAAALARLAAGSPGRALRLADSGGLALYREMIALLAQGREIDGEALHGLAERLGRAGAEPAYHTFMELLVGWLARLVRSGATGEPPAETVSGEDAVARRLLAGRSLEHWAGVWEKVGRLAVRAERANLERKQVVISAFTTLEAASRP